MCVRASITALGALALLFSTASVASPQTLELASRGPRFLAAWTIPGKTVDVTNAAVLRRRVSLDLTKVTANEALKEITRQADLEISYSTAQLPGSRSVSLHAREITVAAALTEVLLDAGVDVALGRSGHLALVKRLAQAAAEVPAADSGTVSGRVTDKATAVPIVGATVVIEGTRQSATTTADGRYSIADVQSGTYDVRARFIGYAPLVTSIVVNAGAESTADFELTKSVQLLDEVVTTGTVVPTEVKAVPTPLTVIGADDIAQRHPQGLQDVIRQAIPTALAFDDPVFSSAGSLFSVRGANSLNGTGTMKILVDGVEAAGATTSPVDPNSVERIEVIRGPQAATLYGADAAGGVIQIFTKRGQAGLVGPQADAQAELGVVQTPYIDHRGVLRQNYTGSVRGGDRDVSYNFGGGYTRLADYVPNGEISRQSSPSLYGGMRMTRGIITADLSARYYRNKLPSVYTPFVLTAGFGPFSRPNCTINDFTNETYGDRIT
ncbi:MAG: carboxypeptidase-like regulatory domain-containing protein, partial [Pseudonocardiales bacterium]|nr:carboxypeptidase-like regulatory domain-containing protein [Pseudonocardiales bacterium]